MVGLRQEHRSDWWVAEMKKTIQSEENLGPVSQLCLSAPRQLVSQDDRAGRPWGRARGDPGERGNRFDALETEQVAEDDDEVEDEGAIS
eukprot:67030-Prymnesium_polylepis.1